MKSLYLRIWLTVVAVLALFALVSGWMWQRHVEQERAQFESQANERLHAWAELLEHSLPAADAPVDEQAQALYDWSARLHLPLALDNASGVRIAASASFVRRLEEGGGGTVSVRLDDGRTLWLPRRTRGRGGVGGGASGPFGLGLASAPGADGKRLPATGAAEGPAGGWLGGGPSGPRLGRLGDGARGDLRGEAREAGAEGRTDNPAGPRPEPQALDLGRPGGRGLEPEGGARSLGLRLGPDSGPPDGPPPLLPPPLGALPRGVGPLVLVALLFVAVAAGAYPVVRRLTRRLEALKQGVEAFGRGDLTQRVDAAGSDEVAAVAATFNAAAERIEGLVRSHQSLLANASHELRSPLARLKMAVAMFADMPEAQRASLRKEIDTNVAELDALVEEVLLASRLDSAQPLDLSDSVDLLGIAAEESARTGATLADDGADALLVHGSERLLRRALRNLLENARRYGGTDVRVELHQSPGGLALVRVCDRGPGVPENLRERIFEPFYRLPGHAEREGGVGLGLSLVRQIAQRHRGQVRCLPREGGGSVFELSLPA